MEFRATRTASAATPYGTDSSEVAARPDPAADRATTTGPLQNHTNRLSPAASTDPLPDPSLSLSHLITTQEETAITILIRPPTTRAIDSGPSHETKRDLPKTCQRFLDLEIFYTLMVVSTI